MSAMARELVEKAGVGESADQVWRQLDRERSKQIGPVPQQAARGAEDGAPILDGERSVHLVPPVREKKRPDAPSWPATATGDQPIQLSLFG
jgi:hypothetical protein